MNPDDQYQWRNRAAWDALAENQDRLAKPARDEDFLNPLKTVDSSGWLGADIRGKSVLCLAAGGGRQGPIYAAAGAKVTVVDLSPKMLELDNVVAKQRKFEIQTIEASMDDLSMLAEGIFDFVIHPVSTCYVPKVQPVFDEVSRVLRMGGLYISQHKQPTSLQSPSLLHNKKPVLEHSYYHDQPLPPEPDASLVREQGTIEYIHRWEELVGGICRAGMVIEDLTEPFHAKDRNSQRFESVATDFAWRSRFLCPYVRIKAKKVREQDSNRTQVWLPSS